MRRLFCLLRHNNWYALFEITPDIFEFLVVSMKCDGGFFGLIKAKFSEMFSAGVQRRTYVNGRPNSLSILSSSFLFSLLEADVSFRRSLLSLRRSEIDMNLVEVVS